LSDEELRQQFAELKAQTTGLQTYVMELRAEVIQRFDDIDRRIDTMAGTIASIDSRLPVLTRSVMAMEARVYKQDDARDIKLAELEARIRKLEGAA
jgi:hypothetical protein